MSSSDPNATLPPGETDPNQLYIAVGRAIHAWEGMEEALARLYAKLMGLPETPTALAEYGAEYRKTVERLDGINIAARSYFIRLPHQNLEAELHAIVETARELCIKRHRVAHGHVTMVAEFKIPEAPAGSGPFTASSRVLWRWGAPFYSMTTLRTDPVGGNAASIEAAQKEFEDLHNRIFKFTSELPARP